MTKRRYTKFVFTLPLLILFVVVVNIGVSQSPPTPIPNPVSLQVLASQSGNYVSYVQANIFPKYADVNQLVLQSTDVIIGTAGTNVCALSPEGSFITTDFQVTVQSVLKGGLQTGMGITVSLAGGRVVFAPQCNTTPCAPPTTAELRAPWFKKMSKGSQYYLFMVGTNLPPGWPCYVGPSVMHFDTTGGPQGVFEITSSGVVMSNSGRLRDPMWQYNNLGSGTFQANVKIAVASEPSVSNPCK